MGTDKEEIEKLVRGLLDEGLKTIRSQKVEQDLDIAESIAKAEASLRLRDDEVIQECLQLIEAQKGVVEGLQELYQFWREQSRHKRAQRNKLREKVRQLEEEVLGLQKSVTEGAFLLAEADHKLGQKEGLDPDRDPEEQAFEKSLSRAAEKLLQDDPTEVPTQRSLRQDRAWESFDKDSFARGWNVSQTTFRYLFNIGWHARADQVRTTAQRLCEEARKKDPRSSEAEGGRVQGGQGPGDVSKPGQAPPPREGC